MLRPIFYVWLTIAALMTACEGYTPAAPERYQEPDQFADQVLKNVGASAELNLVTEIDHSRLAGAEEVYMPPARVVLAENAAFEAELLAQSQLAALDLPLRVLAYENADGEASVTFNSLAFIENRYGLEKRPELTGAYNAAMAQLLNGIPDDVVAQFATDTMETPAIIDIESSHDFDQSVQRARDGIDSQGDTVWFGEIDYQKAAAEAGLTIGPTRLLLFGGPAPGGKAMAEAPTLGLDAFCQKLLIWQDKEGTVHISFNDLIALAKRQGVDVNIPLRVIDFRLNSLFESVAATD